MIVDFTVANYRSIREEVTLSAVAQSNRNNKKDLLTTQPFKLREGTIEVLPALGIFGANASGKTNVLRALDRLLYFIHRAGDQKIDSFPTCTPFGLDSGSKANPTKFRIRIARKHIYSYELHLDNDRVLFEELTYVPEKAKTMHSRLLYRREWIPKDERFKITNGTDFGKSFRKIQLATRERQSFLGVLINSLQHPVVEPLLRWLGFYWRGLGFGRVKYELLFSASVLEKFEPEIKQSVFDLVRLFDTGIDDFEIKASQNESDSEVFRVNVIHKNKKKAVKWSIEEESHGTQELFFLATRCIHTLKWGGIMLVDEFGSNIHPNICNTVIQLFQNRELNPRGAQIFFASHDYNLQNSRVLRRDQIWFTQKRSDGSTNLYPLTDFGARNDLVVDKAYADGRFGAVPILPSLNDLKAITERVYG